MAHLIEHTVAPPERCAYLPDREATMEIRVLVQVTGHELDTLLEQGWRHFGPAYFRPVCRGCQACVSVRIPTATFEPTRSQRRVLRQCAKLRVEIGPPTIDRERYFLYQRWHATHEESHGWKADEGGPEQYATSFCMPHTSAREFAYYEGDELIAVGIADETPKAISCVYCTHSPAHAKLSLGTFNVLTSIAYAKQFGLPYVYLGYRVDGCASLRYKSRFQPQEELSNPASQAHEQVDARWRIVDATREQEAPRASNESPAPTDAA